MLTNSTGLYFTAATSIQEVLEAWGFVYKIYLENGFINENPEEIFTYKQSCNKDSCVILAKIDNKIVGTITCTPDSEIGIPLDSMFKDKLDTVRGKYPNIAEIGLYASCCETESIGIELELILWAGSYVLNNNYDTCIIGTSAKHSRFYKKYFNSDILSEECSYKNLNNISLVLLKLDGSEFNINNKHKGIKYIVNNMISNEKYDKKYDFNINEVMNSPLKNFIIENK
jgi:hypothetical protein